MSSDKKVPQPSKRTATPPDLARALQELYAEKNPHLPPLEKIAKAAAASSPSKKPLKDKNPH
jgi:hypothetical protein